MAVNAAGCGGFAERFDKAAWGRALWYNALPFHHGFICLHSGAIDAA